MLPEKELKVVVVEGLEKTTERSSGLGGLSGTGSEGDDQLLTGEISTVFVGSSLPFLADLCFLSFLSFGVNIANTNI